MNVSKELYDKLQECNMVLDRNILLLSLIGEHVEDSITFTMDGVNKVKQFIHCKFEQRQAFNNDDSIAILNRCLAHNCIPHNQIQLENPSNLVKAKTSFASYNGMQTPCFYEDDDVIYYFYPQKLQINIDKHYINLMQSISYFNQEFDDVYHVKTIVDKLHPNSQPYICVDGKKRIEKNMLRFVLVFNDIDDHYLIRIAYNVRYNQHDNKYVIKFTSVYEEDNIPKEIDGKYKHVLHRLIHDNLYEHYLQEGAGIMKFEDMIAHKIIDLSNRDPDTITLDEIVTYKTVDKDATKLVRKLIHEWHHKTYDYDKIFPYEDILPDGAWPNYYMDKVLTNEEYVRREKYYEGNRIVFNEQLDRIRVNNPNFVKMFKERFNAAKNAIVYGAPQKTVRACMAKLYGNQVLDLLMEEDPQDAVIDPNLRKWKFQ